MEDIPVLDLQRIVAELEDTGERVRVLWQHPDSLAFVARGREYRSEYHVNASEEVTYMIKGTMHLHYRSPEGEESVAVIPEGSVNWMSANTEHSPIFGPDSFALIIERGRRHGETDLFHWYCPKCGEILHEEQFVVEDYTKDPVSKAYGRFFENEDARTCKKCGNILQSATM